MKKLLCATILLLATQSYAQWTNGGGLFLSWGNGSSGFPIFSYRSFGFGNFSFNGATPQARMHLSEHYLQSPWTGTDGNLFRTDGHWNNNNNWTMFTGTSGPNSQMRFRVTSLAQTNDVELGTTLNGDQHFLTNNIRRVTIRRGFGGGATSGFVGFNNQTPNFHLDMLTPERNQGELLLRSRVEGDPTAWMGFLNLAGQGSSWLSPTLMGRQATNFLPALSTVGSIENGQDVGGNPNAVTRFISARDYDPADIPADYTLDRINVIANRRIFQWWNGVDHLMTMEANGFLGVGTELPGNRVEINSDFYDPLTGLPNGFPNAAPVVTDLTDNGIPGFGGANATGYSGLRFSDLTANSNPFAANPGQGVLALDSNGDVIYVAASEGSGFVDCGDQSGAANLTADSKVNLSDFNLYFENNNVFGQNHVGFGYDNCPALPAKVSVFQTHPNTVPNNSTSISGINEDVSNTILKMFVGVHGSAQGIQDPSLRIDNVGGEFLASNATDNYGVIARVDFPVVMPPQLFANNFGGYFEAVGAGLNNRGIQVKSGDAGSSNVGVFASAQTFSPNTTIYNVGGDFIATGATKDNIGVRGLANNGTFTVGVYGGAGAPQPGGVSYAGYFDGDVYIAVGFGPSDVNMKTNIVDYDSSLLVINQLDPKSFEFTDANYQGMHLPSGHQYGLIAQDVEQILPALVSNNVHPAQYDSTGAEIYPEYNFKGVDYTSLIPILVGGIKEQQAQIDEKDSLINDLNDRLTQLENCLSGILPLLCQMSNSIVEPTEDDLQRELLNAIDVELSDRNNIVLNQNVPNPFAERTEISFSIPETVQKAQIHFYNGYGALINTVDILERGNGRINVYASDLSTGVYTYSLVADGKVVATKRMVKE